MSVEQALRIPSLAQIVARSGRGNDTMLAHISPREIAILKKHGGSGKINPATGLPEFDDSGFNFDFSGGGSTPSTNYNFDTPAPTPNVSDFSTPTYNADTNTLGSTPAAAAPQTNYNFDNTSTPGLTDFSTPQMPSSTPTAAAAAPSASGGFLKSAASSLGSGVGSLLTGAGKAGLNYLTNNIPSASTLAKLGVAGLGVKNAQAAQAQGQKAQKDIQALADPYKAQSQQKLQQAASGNLDPAQQQEMEAMRAQAAQNLSNNGQESSTAAQQSMMAQNNQAEVFRQNLMNEGLQLAGIADQLTVQAINAGYQADMNAQKAATDFATSLAQLLGATPNAIP